MLFDILPNDEIIKKKYKKMKARRGKSGQNSFILWTHLNF